MKFVTVMHDSDSGIGTDSGMIPFLAGIGIGIGIKKTELYWNRNRNRKLIHGGQCNFVINLFHTVNKKKINK